MTWEPVPVRPGGDSMRAVRAIVWDLDGTLYRGPAPLRAYAAALADHLDGSAAPRFARYANALVTSPGRTAPYYDLWNALTSASHEAGLPYEVANACFLDVRRRIIRGEFPVEVPAGVISLVAALARARVPMAVVTNSDGASGRDLLESLGLKSLVRHIHADAMKPGGFVPATRALFPDLPSAQVLSVGDNYRNDIEPALTCGMVALHVRTPGARGGPATWTVPRLEEGIGWIAHWASAGGNGEAAAGAGATLG